MSFNAAALANQATAALRAYDPGHDLPALRRRFGAQLAELGSNESPLGASPAAIAAMRAALDDSFRYPDPKGVALKAALAAANAVNAAQITFGNGSHELLMLIAQCFAGATTSVVYSQFGFAVFAIATTAAGATALSVPALAVDHADAPYGHDLSAIANAVRADTRLIYLANPNNPTGTHFSDGALGRFLTRVPANVLVVVDEAYHEYVDAPKLTTARRYLDGYPNLIVTRTFSKAYGLAGLRIGYMISDPGVAAIVERLRESFNVNSIALAAAEAALADQAFLQHVRDWNQSERDWLGGQLRERGWCVLPSQTNFVLVDLGRDTVDLERHLFERGVIVRPMTGYGLGHCLRVSVGSHAENERLLAALP